MVYLVIPNTWMNVICVEELVLTVSGRFSLIHVDLLQTLQAVLDQKHSTCVIITELLLVFLISIQIQVLDLVDV